MKDEAMKLALGALEDFVDVIKYDNEQDDIGRRACCDVLSYKPHSESCKAKQAITAIKQAIKELESQEPVAWMSPSWIDPNTRGWQSDSFESIPIEGWLPIYTTPPQRTEQNFCPRCGKRTNDIHTCTPPQRSESSGKPSAWVGLTNEELTDLFYNTNLGQQSAVSQAVALLKQKNT